MADIRGYKWAAFCGLVAIVAMIPTAAGLIFGFAAAFMLFLLLGIPFAALLVWYARWRESDGEREWRTYIEERRAAQKAARIEPLAAPPPKIQPTAPTSIRRTKGEIDMFRALGYIFTPAAFVAWMLAIAAGLIVVIPELRALPVPGYGITAGQLVLNVAFPAGIALAVLNGLSSMFGPLHLRGVDRAGTNIALVAFLLMAAALVLVPYLRDNAISAAWFIVLGLLAYALYDRLGNQGELRRDREQHEVYEAQIASLRTRNAELEAQVAGMPAPAPAPAPALAIAPAFGAAPAAPADRTSSSVPAAAPVASATPEVGARLRLEITPHMMPTRYVSRAAAVPAPAPKPEPAAGESLTSRREAVVFAAVIPTAVALAALAGDAYAKPGPAPAVADTAPESREGEQVRAPEHVSDEAPAKVEEAAPPVETASDVKPETPQSAGEGSMQVAEAPSTDAAQTAPADQTQAPAAVEQTPEPDGGQRLVPRYI